MIPDYPGEPNVIIRVIGSGKREDQSPRNGSQCWRGATKERGWPPDAGGLQMLHKARSRA